MLNKAILNGRLTKAPELKQTNSGKSVCSFTIAVDRSRDREKTDFVPIVAWGKTAEFVNQWFGKGDLITIVGCIEVRNYEDNYDFTIPMFREEFYTNYLEETDECISGL